MRNLKYIVTALIAASLVSCGSGGDGSSSQTSYDQNNSTVNGSVNLSCEGIPYSKTISAISSNYGVTNLNRSDVIAAVKDGCFAKTPLQNYNYASKISYTNNDLDQSCKESGGWFKFTRCSTNPTMFSLRQEDQNGNIVSDYGSSKQMVITNILNNINSATKILGVPGTSGIRIEQTSGDYIVIDRSAPIVAQPVYQKSGTTQRQVYSSYKLIQ